MAIASEDPSNPCYEIKSADLSLVALLLKTTDIAEVSRALKQQMAESPGFFDQDPVVIDVSGLTLVDDETIDLARLMLFCANTHLCLWPSKGLTCAFILAKGARLG
jgi:septum site-determining protein MinC